MKNIVSQSMSRGQGNELLNKLEAAGLGGELAQRVIDSKGNNLAAKVVRSIQNRGYGPTTSQKLARKIMGKNFFGVEEATKYFGVDPSRQQLAVLSEIPFTKAELREVKDTHILIAVFPMSTLDIRGKVERQLFYSHENAWYNSQAFAKEKKEVSWQLVRKTPVPNSTSKTWQEQQAILAKNEETPKVQVMVYTIIGHFLATGEWLFENVYVRCSDVDSRGDRVDVGSFDAEGLRVSGHWDDDRYSGLDVAAVRKFN